MVSRSFHHPPESTPCRQAAASSDAACRLALYRSGNAVSLPSGRGNNSSEPTRQTIGRYERLERMKPQALGAASHIAMAVPPTQLNTANFGARFPGLPPPSSGQAYRDDARLHLHDTPALPTVPTHLGDKSGCF